MSPPGPTTTSGFADFVFGGELTGCTLLEAAGASPTMGVPLVECRFETVRAGVGSGSIGLASALGLGFMAPRVVADFGDSTGLKAVAAGFCGVIDTATGPDACASGCLRTVCGGLCFVDVDAGLTSVCFWVLEEATTTPGLAVPSEVFLVFFPSMVAFFSCRRFRTTKITPARTVPPTNNTNKDARAAFSPGLSEVDAAAFEAPSFVLIVDEGVSEGEAVLLIEMDDVSERVGEIVGVNEIVGVREGVRLIDEVLDTVCACTAFSARSTSSAKA